LEAASGGTLFLDEVEAMSPAVQARLLRALESGEIRPSARRRRVVWTCA
jgi:arginine utilization regulatory protein